jgi:hypothetical protein
MKKLKLDAEALQIQSFETAGAESLRGTVQGAEITGAACPPETEAPSCGIWCPPTRDPNPTEPCLC